MLTVKFKIQTAWLKKFLLFGKLREFLPVTWKKEDDERIITPAGMKTNLKHGCFFLTIFFWFAVEHVLLTTVFGYLSRVITFFPERKTNSNRETRRNLRFQDVPPWILKTSVKMISTAEETEDATSAGQRLSASRGILHEGRREIGRLQEAEEGERDKKTAGINRRRLRIIQMVSEDYQEQKRSM